MRPPRCRDTASRRYRAFIATCNAFRGFEERIRPGLIQGLVESADDFRRTLSKFVDDTYPTADWRVVHLYDKLFPEAYTEHYKRLLAA